MKKTILAGSLALAMAIAAAGPVGAQMLEQGGKLTEGQRINSPSGSHYLVMQSDGNLCIYTRADKFVWCSMSLKGSGSSAVLQSDGNLVVYGPDGEPTWSTETMAFFDSKYGTAQYKPVRMGVTDDGKLTLFNAAGAAVWTSGDGALDEPAGPATTAKPEQPVAPVAPPVPEAAKALVSGYTGPTEVKEMLVTLPGSSGPQELTVEVAEGKVIFQKDMVLGTVEEVAGSVMSNIQTYNTGPRTIKPWMWPESTIIYSLPRSHPRYATIQKGIADLQSRTNLCFKQRTNEEGYIEFMTGNGNYAPIGRSRNKGLVSIKDDSYGIVIHELLHSAGFYHTQSRGDRDSYVTINRRNVLSHQLHNFDKQGPETVIGPYDFGSIMHYFSTAFSSNGRTTIEPKFDREKNIKLMNNYENLSDVDIGIINTIYAPGPCKPDYVPPKPEPETPAEPAKPVAPPAPPVAKKVTTNPTVPTATATAVGVRGRLNPGEQVREGEKLVSSNGRYQLRGTPEGEFVIEEVATGRSIYTFPLTPPFAERPARGYLKYQPDGNVCIQSSANKAYCATNGRDQVAPVILGKSEYALVTDDGRFVLVGKDGREIWATNPASAKPTTAVTQPQPGPDGLINIALGKTAYFRSDAQAAAYAGPEKAVDGDTNGVYTANESNSVAVVANPMLGQLLQIELGEQYDIDHIVIWAPKGEGRDALRNLIVSVSPDQIVWREGIDSPTISNPSGWSLGRNIQFPEVSPNWAASDSYRLQVNRRGKIVSVSIHPTVTPIPFSIAEVQIFGKPVPPGSRR